MDPKSRSLGAIASLAGRQYGVVTRSQLIGAGLSSEQIKTLTRRSHLHRIHRGVFAVGHRHLSQEGRWLAAVIACGPGASLSHGPAGQLLGILDRLQRFALHVSLTADRSPTGIVTHRPRQLPPEDTTVKRGIPVTTGTRTVWDLATTLSPLQTRRAFEQAEKLRILDRGRLAALLASDPRHRNGGALRELLAERALPLESARSRLEEIALETCRDHGLPIPAVNVPVLGHEVDLFWASSRFVAELDGSDHQRPERRALDNQRDIALARAGYLVRRYTWAELNDRGRAAAEIAEIVRERSR
jgi:very-short-patch-repair endonuclease